MARERNEEHGFPLFIDCEASSLSDASYPIEIAWSLPDGSIRAFLVDPSTVPAWTDWSPKAEELHGISRAKLLADGHPPREVARALIDDLEGRTVHSDAPDWERQWLGRLFEACRMHFPDILIANAEKLLLQEAIRATDAMEAAGEWLAHCSYQERYTAGPAHRAGNDVLHLLNTWRRLADMRREGISDRKTSFSLRPDDAKPQGDR